MEHKRLSANKETGNKPSVFIDATNAIPRRLATKDPHHIKDVVLKKDYSKITKGNAPSNMSILRNISINIFRSNRKKKITQSIRLLGNSAKKTMSLLLT